MATYAYGIANLTTIPSKLSLIQNRIDVSLEIDVTLVSVTHVVGGLEDPGDKIVFVFAAPLSDFQLTTLVNLVDIVFEETPVERVYPENRAINTTRIPGNLNDIVGGYTIGTSAVNTINSNKYSCIISTTGNAVWIEVNDYDTPFSIYDATVSTAGEFKTYPLLSAAILDGKRKIFVKSGVYIETSQIVVPSGTIIHGMRASDTIIVFQGLAVPGLYADGNQGIEETSGTVSINQNTNTITGVGTTFTNLAPGDKIFMEGIFYGISAISSDTVLIISEIYRGPSLANISYIGRRFFRGFRISEISISNSTGSPCTSSAIYFKGLEGLILNNIFVSRFVNNIVLEKCLLVKLDTLSSRASTGTGVIFTDIIQSDIYTLACINNTSDGLIVNGTTIGMTLTNVFSNSNGGRGIYNDGTSSSNKLMGCSAKNNIGPGYEVALGVSYIIFDGCESYGNSIGALVFGTKISFTSCALVLNSGDGLQMTSECAINTSSIGGNGSNGINITSGDNYTIDSNAIYGNTLNGVLVTGTISSITISTNSIYSNGERGMSIENTNPGDVILTANIIKGNGADGMYMTPNNAIISNCRVINNLIGVNITASANDTIISGCNLLGNGTNLIDSGVGTLINATKS